MPVAVVQGSVVYYIRTDHIGRPIFATDSAANIVWEVNYLPFGGVESSSGANLDLRFPGQWFQLESGLHQNWMRDYDPTTGRYMQADPLGLVDGASVYNYALQNPMRYTDPTGLTAQCPARPPSALTLDYRCTPRDLWKPYYGDPDIFHCGFEGFLENREPTPENPIAECFYDNSGNLVDENHRYASYAGTPDQYSGENSPWNHGVSDSGGILKSGWSPFWASAVKRSAILVHRSNHKM